MARHRVWSVAAVAMLAASGAALVAVGPAQATMIASVAGSYHAVAPMRILDTRYGLGSRGAVPAGGHVVVTLPPDVPAGASVVLNITATQPATAGAIVAAEDGVTPAGSNLNFAKGQTVPNLAVVQTSAANKVDLYNESAGSVQLVADLSGYFTGGTPTAQGAFGPLALRRVLDTRTVEGSPVPPGGSVDLDLSSALPASTSAVVLNVTVTRPTAAGSITVYPAGITRPVTSNLNFVGGQTVANLVTVPVSSTGHVSLVNASKGTVQLVADLSGYFLAGDPTAAGALAALAPVRLLDTRIGVGGSARPVAPGGYLAVPVTGRGGVPLTSVIAVVLNVTVTSPTMAGSIVVYAGGGTVPTVSNLNFSKGQTVPNLVVAPVNPTTGSVEFHNQSMGTVQLIADVSGYVFGSTAPLPSVVSTSHYVRNITGGAGDAAIMQREGNADAAAGSTFVLLDIGAQLNDKSGVQLSTTSTNLTYDQLVTALQAYLTGFGAVPGATVAVSTNNDADDWSAYTGAERGQDWAAKVVNRLVTGSGVSVVGASDIESGFFSTQAQAAQWETGFLGAATTKKLIFNGSADGCPSVYGASGSCNGGWTQAGYYALAGGGNPTQIQALPQIYYQAQAVQWANIDRVGGLKIVFDGALTEYASDSTTFPPRHGWAALWHALSTVVSTPKLPVMTDLQVDS